MVATVRKHRKYEGRCTLITNRKYEVRSANRGKYEIPAQTHWKYEHRERCLGSTSPTKVTRRRKYETRVLNVK